MKWKWLLAMDLLLYFLFTAVQVSAMGTPEDQSEDVFSLGEVVVSGRQEGIEAAETVHEITAEELKKSNARTLDEALNMLSDVNVQVGNEGVPRIDIRGFRTRQVLLLLDGIPMNSAFDQQFDPSTIPVENISKIKVTAGASSVLYGQGGLGGVINIITKKGKKGFTGLVGNESGDGQPYFVKASVAGGKGMIDYFASGTVFRRDSFPVAEPINESIYEQNGYRTNSDNTRDNAFINLGFSPSNDLYIALTGNWVQGGYGKPASAINNKFDPYAPPAKFGRVDWFGGYTLQLAADYDVSKALNIRSMIYYNRIDQDNNQYDDENYNTIDNPNIPNSYKLRNIGINRGASIQPKYDLGRGGIITLGFSGEWNTWSDSGLVKSGGNSGAQGGHGIGGGSPPYELFPVQDHKDLYIFSTAIEYQVVPIENLGLAVGYAHFWQSRDEATTDDYSVSASTYYDLFRGTRLMAAFQRNVRFPSLSQLYLRDSDNPYLLNEKVFHYQLGVEQKLPWRSLFRIYGFRSDLYNFIALNQNVTPAKNTNFSLYRFCGFETALQTNFLRNLNMKAGYTYLASQDLSGVGRDEVQYVPRDKFTFVGSYAFDFGLTPFVSVIYVANSFVYSKQQIATVSKHMMANYTLVNLKVSQRLFKDRVNLYVGADNIFNKDYEQSYGIPRPGRFIYGGFEYRFSL
jgi:vitamin B12 transporter